jgi:hypothetical protein
VIHRGNREIGSTHLAAGDAQTLEGLRRRNLMHQVQIDKQESRLAFGMADDVAVPKFFKQSAWLWHFLFTA